MKNSKYKAILSDLGNVLVNFDHKIAVRKILQYTAKNEEDIYNLFFDSGLTSLYERGKLSPEEFFDRVKDDLGLDIRQEDFFDIWNNIFFEVPLNIKIHTLLRKVKGECKLIMLSNINKTHFEFLKDRYSIFKDFDKLVLSYEVGFRKPAPEIYDAAVEKAGVPRDKVFYIDDRRDLVEAAAKLGIKGVAFTGEEAFLEAEREILG
ncbi:MAG: HAD family phosphatase [Candidatus Omnitrophota bacterium]